MAILTAAQVRTRSRSDDVADVQQFSDEDLDAYVATFQDIAERYCGRYFEEASVTETVEVCGTVMILRTPLVSIDTFEVEGTASTVYELDTNGMASGVLRLTSHVTGTVEIGYTYGAATPGIERACVQYVRSSALRDNSSASRDVISQGFEGGSTRYSTPDWAAGRPTGYIEVDSLLNAHGRALPGVA